MEIKEINIKNIGCILDLHLDFDSHMNIICGPNSIGKTTILESIASMFAYGKPKIKKRAGSQSGSIDVTINIDGETKGKSINIDSFSPDEGKPTSSFSDEAPKIISIKVTRDFTYSDLSSIPRDESRALPTIWQETISGINYTGVKGWFVNRYLYSAHPKSLSEEQMSNFNLAKKCFSIINDQYHFSRVLADSNDIMVQTPQGEIYYEYLSSGFKSIIYLLFSTIKEIEFRFNENKILAEDFDGIILIDEIESHLHPEWQEKITTILKEVFPRAQFVLTTHSPHVIQTADPNQIIALELDETGEVCMRRDLEFGEYGYKGWTVEEILYDVMGMKTLRTEVYREMMEKFDHAIDAEDAAEARSIYSELEKLLHPRNPQRKLLKFQLAEISKV